MPLLTQIKGSKLQEFVAKNSVGLNGPLYLDRDPEIFNLVLKYLRSERRFMPKNLTQDVTK